MNFRDFYQPGKIDFSFETFPPKDEAGVTGLFEALKELAPFRPAFISVTYGAGGSTRDLTRDLAVRIHRELHLTTAFHFTCVGADRLAIRSYVEHLKKEGLNLIVALRGDPPKGETKFVKPADGFLYATELVRYLKEIDGFSIAVAGYPEGHVEAKSKKEDLIHLKEKVDSGADIVITQLFFDNADYFDFAARAKKIGITVPIIPGILPVLNLKQLTRITSMSGAKIPDDLRLELEACGEDNDKMREVGIRWATRQCRDLVDKGAPGIHFYILNRAYSTRRIIENLQK
ncbi:MAG: methylenetetrahydrofolate reductase [NAD(P)H] [Deltaproteobacteria bacterium]|nr:methylenetetrahydrofolate reductase [NAD(P)H] [Deltaproteobacteria bacterium]